jgi:hypothetical protein
MAGIGNAWHIPNTLQPWGQASLRFPLDTIGGGTTVMRSNGQHFQGPEIAGNQTQWGSALMIRKAGDASWTPLALSTYSC